MARYALPLDGYEDASTWGYDDQQGTYFAHLWRNTSDGFDDPDIWLSGYPAISTPVRLAGLISARTGVSTALVVRAMAAAKTAPEAGELARLADELAATAV